MISTIPTGVNQTLTLAQNDIYAIVATGSTDDTVIAVNGYGNVVALGNGNDIYTESGTSSTTFLADGTGFKVYSSDNGGFAGDALVLADQENTTYTKAYDGANLVVIIQDRSFSTHSTHVFINALYTGEPTIVGCNSFPAVDNIVEEEYSFYSNTATTPTIPEQTWGQDVAVVNPWDCNDNYATEPIKDEVYQPLTAPAPIFASEVTTADPFANMTPNYIEPVAQPSYGREVEVLSPVF